jgi:carboxyl-terminal processing protease
VALTIYRDGWQETEDIKIFRDKIIIPAMEWKIINDNVAYIQIYQFDDSLIYDFEIAARQILQSNAKKIILDLRNNPGGYLEVSQEITGWFLPTGQIVAIEDFGNNKERKLYKTNGNYSLEKYPIVILINQGSASASEILAGSLRDNKGIKLIGEKSFGKGSVQEVINLHDGSYLKITIAKWLTPNGTSISEVGLEPDIKVEITDEDADLEKDTQLEKALEIIKNLK